MRDARPAALARFMIMPGHDWSETVRLIGAVAAEVTRELIDHIVVHPKPGWRAGI